MATKKGLGKGLDALFTDNKSTLDASNVDTLKVNEIEPNRNQPRKSFDDEPLQQLADSIREHGVIQPIMVRPISTGGYQIIAGERRWRASRMAGLTEVPVIIREYDDNKTMEIALIENLQRENLNPIEEALGYRELMETYNMTQADVSNSVGKSRSAVANMLRLLNLPEAVITMLRENKISAGHARALLGFDDDQEILLAVAHLAAQGQYTVRDVEELAKNPQKVKKPAQPTKQKRDSYIDEMELALNVELHRKVKIIGKEKGKIELEYYSKQDLADIARRLAGE